MVYFSYESFPPPGCWRIPKIFIVRVSFLSFCYHCKGRFCDPPFRDAHTRRIQTDFPPPGTRSLKWRILDVPIVETLELQECMHFHTCLLISFTIYIYLCILTSVYFRNVSFLVYPSQGIRPDDRLSYYRVVNTFLWIFFNARFSIFLPSRFYRCPPDFTDALPVLQMSSRFYRCPPDFTDALPV